MTTRRQGMTRWEQTHLRPDTLYAPEDTRDAALDAILAFTRDTWQQPRPVWAVHLLASTTGEDYAVALAAN